MNTQPHISALFILRQASANSAEHGLFSEAKEIALRAVDLAEKMYGAQSEAYLTCLEEAVERCVQSRDYAEAEKIQSVFLELNRLLFGETSAESILGMRVLADILRAGGKDIEAKRIERCAGQVMAGRFGLQ